jgi:hypothetical protein
MTSPRLRSQSRSSLLKKSNGGTLSNVAPLMPDPLAASTQFQPCLNGGDDSRISSNAEDDPNDGKPGIDSAVAELRRTGQSV